MKNKILHVGAYIKQVDENDDELIIRGMASTDDKDRVGDVIEPDAWKSGLGNYRKNPIILFNHNSNEPIGRAKSIKQTPNGLEIEAKISKSAGKIVDLIREKVLGAFSVGFMIKDARYDEDSESFRITKAELLEVSVVSVPANQSATFSVKKSLSEEEYIDLKNSVTDNTELKSSETQPQKGPSAATKEKKMDENEIQELLKSAVSDAGKEFAKALKMQKAEEKAAEEKATKEAEALAAKEKQDNERIATVVRSGTEELLKDLQAKFEDREKSLEETLAEYKKDLEEKADEIRQMRSNKAIFADRNDGRDFWEANEKDLVDAHLLGVITQKGWNTSLGKDLMTKATNANTGVQAPEVTEENFETFVSTSLERDIELELVLAPIFRTIQMRAASMVIPTMPDAGYAEFLATGSTAGTGATGAFQGNLESRDAGSPNSGIKMGSKVLTVAKLVSKSFIANETEEDAIIPILPLIRESLVRAHARAVEHSILLGGSANDAISSGYNGLFKIAVDDSKTLDMAVGSPAGSPVLSSFRQVVAADLLNLRQAMGKYGRRPGDVIYVVSLDAYYDLLDDAEFQNINEVGSELATKVRGQIGQVYGSPVIVCDEFPSTSGDIGGNPFAIAVNPLHFVMPILRGATVEQDYDVENQRRVLVATQRRGFDQIFNVAGQVVAHTY